LLSNFELHTCYKQCDCVLGHELLEGTATAKTAVFNDRFSHAICDDMIGEVREQKNDAIHEKKHDYHMMRVRARDRARKQYDDAYDISPVVKTADELAEEHAQSLRPGTTKTGHLSCPYCDSWFSSSQPLRYHKLTQHNAQYNKNAEKKG